MLPLAPETPTTRRLFRMFSMVTEPSVQTCSQPPPRSRNEAARRSGWPEDDLHTPRERSRCQRADGAGASASGRPPPRWPSSSRSCGASTMPPSALNAAPPAKSSRIGEQHGATQEARAAVATWRCARPRTSLRGCRPASGRSTAQLLHRTGPLGFVALFGPPTGACDGASSRERSAAADGQGELERPGQRRGARPRCLLRRAASEVLTLQTRSCAATTAAPERGPARSTSSGPGRGHN